MGWLPYPRDIFTSNKLLGGIPNETAKQSSVAFCSPAKSLTCSGLKEASLVGQTVKVLTAPKKCLGTEDVALMLNEQIGCLVFGAAPRSLMAAVNRYLAMAPCP